MALQSLSHNKMYTSINMIHKFRVLILTTSFLCISLLSLCDTNTIKGEIYSLSSDQAILGRYFEDQYYFLDTTIIETGKFSFTIDDSSPKGMYFIQVDRYKTIEVIYNKENIDFSTDYYHHKEDFLEKSSPSNKRYYQKIQQQQQLQKDIQNQRVLSLKVGASDIEKQSAKALHEKALTNLNDFFEGLKQSKKTYPSDALVLAQFQPTPDNKLTFIEQQFELKKSYFDYIDVNDTILLHANILTKKIYNYIMLYRDRSLNPKAQDSSYRKCVDNLIPLSTDQNKVTDFMFSYLVENFTRMAITDILPYIKEQYLIKFKTESRVTRKIDAELAKIERLKPGHIAPNFSHVDMVGNNFELHKYKSEYTLIMFWASWCSHCRHALPNVKILYDDQIKKKVQIVAVALDSKEDEWKKFLTTGDYGWINITDLKGWEGDIVKDYMVHSTPTFYLLDKDKKIIQKAKNISVLESYFK